MAKKDPNKDYLKKLSAGETPKKPRKKAKTKTEVSHQEIVTILTNQYHRDTRQWICIPEMRVGTGYGKTSSRQIDLFAFNCYPARGHKTIAYEVKVSRGDFLRDIKKPEKQRGARLYASEVYYAAPAGMLSVDEIPLWAGLIEIHIPDLEQPTLPGILPPKMRVWAEKVRESANTPRLRPSWGFICSMLRRVPCTTPK